MAVAGRSHEAGAADADAAVLGSRRAERLLQRRHARAERDKEDVAAGPGRAGRLDGWLRARLAALGLEGAAARCGADAFRVDLCDGLCSDAVLWLVLICASVRL